MGRCRAYVKAHERTLEPERLEARELLEEREGLEEREVF
jgi:hypothetical protein